MSRPRKGVGEHRLLKKGPLLVTTALLTFYPICVAEAATSSFEKKPLSSPSGLYAHLASHLTTSTLLDRLQNQPKSYLNPRSLSSVPLSVETLDTLKSTLSNYQNQLNTLKNSKAADPKNQSNYARAITDVENRISDLKTRISALESALKDYKTAQNTLSDALKTLNGTQTTLSNATNAKTEAQASSDASKIELDTAQSNLDASKAKKALSDAALTHQQEAEASALQTLNQRTAQKQEAEDAAALAQETFNEASSKVSHATQELSNASSTKAQAQQSLEEATTKLQSKQTEVDAARKTYNQTVFNYNETLQAYDLAYSNYLSSQSEYQTAQTNLNVAEAALNQAQYNYDNNLIPDPSAPASVVSQGITVKVYNQITSSVPQRSDTAYNLCKTTTLTNIQNSWGGGDILGCGNDFVLLHYTGYFTPTENITYLMNQADDGFYLSIDGVPVITNDWRLKGCSGNWYPINLQAGRTYYLDAWMYEWGGGACSTLYYQSTTNWGVAPAAWYTTTQPTPMIKDPAKLALLQEAQGEYNEALAAYTTASTNWNLAQVNQQQAASNATAAYYQVIDTANTLNAAYAELDVDQNAFNQAQVSYSEAESTYNQAQLKLDAAQEEKASSLQTLNEALSEVSSATSQLQTAEQDCNTEAQKSQAAQTSNEQASLEVESNNIILNNSSNKYQQSVVDLSNATALEQQAITANKTASDKVEEIKNNIYNLETSNEASLKLANSSASEIPATLDEANRILNLQPEPEPTPEPEGSPDIPKDLSADNLMDVDLTEVDPTELSEEQAEQLVEAALETFETATEGSPEYQQALDALALAAQQDDIVLDESIAAIPGVGQAAQAVVAVFNIVGNVGADISPKVRKKAQTLVVTTLVVGQIAQNAAMATAAAASFRRRN